MSKTSIQESVAPLPAETDELLQHGTGNSSASTNPFRRSLAEKERAKHSSAQNTGSSRVTSLGNPPTYRSSAVSAERADRKDARSQISSVPDRSSLDSSRYAPSASTSKAPAGHRRRASSLKERFPGDPSLHPLDQIARETKLAQRSPHLRKQHQPRPDTVDILDDSGLNYHHEGPYDAALFVRNTSYKNSPVAALAKSNAEALKATPNDKIRDSLNDHRPLDGTAIVPSGHRDAFGRLYQYEEGTDMQREPGADYKRWPGIKYLPEDLKGKGEPSYSIERALKEHKMSPSRHAGQGDEYELVERPRPGSSDATTRRRPVRDEPSRGHAHSRSHNLSGEIKRRMGSLRRKDD